jgi:hypothetical protein
VIAEARAAGYREIVGDTLPIIQTALEMYDRMGLERSPGASDIIPTTAINSASIWSVMPALRAPAVWDAMQ